MAGIQPATFLKIRRLEPSSISWSSAWARSQIMLSPVFKKERLSWWKGRKNFRKRWTPSNQDTTIRTPSINQKISVQISSSSKKKSRSQRFILNHNNTLCPPFASIGSCWAIKGTHCSSNLVRNSVQSRHNWLSISMDCLHWIPFCNEAPGSLFTGH